MTKPGDGTTGAGAEEMRVLVVEDEDDTAAMLAELLEGWGFRAAIARTGAEARKIASDFRPRIVLMDLGLPDHHGYRVARMLRDDAGPNQPVFVVVTGWAEPVNQSLSADAGISHHFVKPVNPHALHAVLDRYQHRVS